MKIKTYWKCIIALLVIMIGFAFLAHHATDKSVTQLLFCLGAFVSGSVALVVLWLSWRKDDSKLKWLPSWKSKDIIVCPFLLWPITGCVIASMMMATCKASEVAVITNTVADSSFQMLSGKETYFLTSVDGKTVIIVPAGSMKIDAENNKLITSSGTYTIIRFSDGILLKGSDGMVYVPSVALVCYIIAGAIVVGVFVYAGCKVYHCVTNLLNNYSNNIASNAADVVSSNYRSAAKISNASSISTLLPSLPVIPKGAAHVMGPPTSMFQFPAGSSLWLTNMDNHMYQSDVSSSNWVDVFGNPINEEFLWQIDATNSFLVTSNGQWIPCPLETSTDLVNWIPTTQIVVGWISGASGQAVSITTVTMTAGLKPYGTNWVKLSGNVITESWTLATYPWPTGSSQGYVKLVPSQ